MGAAYMKLTAAEDDALLAVEVDATIAAEAQIHEVVMVCLLYTSPSPRD